MEIIFKLNGTIYGYNNNDDLFKADTDENEIETLSCCMGYSGNVINDIYAFCNSYEANFSHNCHIYDRDALKDMLAYDYGNQDIVPDKEIVLKVLSYADIDENDFIKSLENQDMFCQLDENKTYNGTDFREDKISYVTDDDMKKALTGIEWLFEKENLKRIILGVGGEIITVDKDDVTKEYKTMEIKIKNGSKKGWVKINA